MSSAKSLTDASRRPADTAIAATTNGLRYKWGSSHNYKGQLTSSDGTVRLESNLNLTWHTEANGHISHNSSNRMTITDAQTRMIQGDGFFLFDGAMAARSSGPSLPMIFKRLLLKSNSGNSGFVNNSSATVPSIVIRLLANSLFDRSPIVSRLMIVSSVGFRVIGLLPSMM